jgi:hypothetical protein
VRPRLCVLCECVRECLRSCVFLAHLQRVPKLQHSLCPNVWFHLHVCLGVRGLATERERDWQRLDRLDEISFFGMCDDSRPATLQVVAFAQPCF